MAVKMYDEWIKESEQVNPVPAPPPAELAAPAETPPAANPPEVSDASQVDDTSQIEVSEVDRFDEIDKARKEAIKAFKEKQKEYMAIPIETRKNPVSEEDKQTVEALKSELSTLNQTMKDAVAEYDKFNDEMLGIESESSDIEP